MSSILIKDAYVITGNDLQDSYVCGWVLVIDSKVAAHASGAVPHELLASAERVLEGKGILVMPGFVNSHTHLSQTFVRGRADGLNLLEALREVIWPIQSAMTAEDVRLASLLGLVENLRSGVTSVIEHNKIPYPASSLDHVAESAVQVGMRMCLVRGWADLGEGAERIETIIDSAARLYERCRAGSDLVSMGFGPMAPWRCSENSIRTLVRWARDRGLPTHMHVAETQQEVRAHKRRTGLRPIEWLYSLDALGPDVQLVHCVWVTDHELDLIARSGATVIHCPVSNMYLAAGIAPVYKMLERNISVKLGTDGQATNNSQNVLETLKCAVLLARTRAKNPRVLPTQKALTMINGEHLAPPNTPSGIAVGSRADLTLVDLSAARNLAIDDPASSLVHNHAGALPHTVIVNGKIVLDAGKVVGLDEVALIRECSSAAQQLFRRAGITTRASNPGLSGNERPVVSAL
jgi:5-methylthioadenosine/S-adenosylhomocysteine deaminase